MNTPTQEPSLDEATAWDEQFFHWCAEPYTHSLCGIFRGNHKLVECSDRPVCPICDALEKDLR